MNTLRAGKAIIAGVTGTAAMTALMLMAPAMGLPPMNVGAMLGAMMGGSTVLGWVAHFTVGAILALAFAALVAPRLPGPSLVRGMAYGVVPWLAAQLVVMPMMGAGFFSGSLAAAAGSLMGHLVYGAVVGVVYGGREATVAAVSGP